MSIAWIMPAVVGALMALYTALRIFDSRGAAEQWWGLGIGVVVGVLVVALVTV
ncbi:MAG: hypothetical protein HUU29_12885, partial [Planctomycetaceae bacterium]|nr:hypothetical protein [Planctomycetaceae bacterium]